MRSCESWSWSSGRHRNRGGNSRRAHRWQGTRSGRQHEPHLVHHARISTLDNVHRTSKKSTTDCDQYASSSHIKWRAFSQWGTQAPPPHQVVVQSTRQSHIAIRSKLWFVTQVARCRLIWHQPKIDHWWKHIASYRFLPRAWRSSNIACIVRAEIRDRPRTIREEGNTQWIPC